MMRIPNLLGCLVNGTQWQLFFLPTPLETPRLKLLPKAWILLRVRYSPNKGLHYNFYNFNHGVRVYAKVCHHRITGPGPSSCFHFNVNAQPTDLVLVV